MSRRSCRRSSGVSPGAALITVIGTASRCRFFAVKAAHRRKFAARGHDALHVLAAHEIAPPDRFAARGLNCRRNNDRRAHTGAQYGASPSYAGQVCTHHSCRSLPSLLFNCGTARRTRHLLDATRIVEVETVAVKCVLPRQMCHLILILRSVRQCRACPVAMQGIR